MKVLVAYESMGGHTHEAAEAIATAVRKAGSEAVVKPVAQVRASDVDAADVLFFGTWVHGFIFFGVEPAEVNKWVPALPLLMGKPVGVFCTYAFNPHGVLQTLGTMLEARGAVIAGEHAFYRARPGEGAAAFVQNVLEFVEVPHL